MKEIIVDKVAEISEYLPKDKTGAPIVPIDLNIILGKYQLTPQYINFSDQNIAGAFDRGARCIYINSTDPKTRRTFTIAHELGHYFLHQDVDKDVLFRERPPRDSHERREHIETEADLFAAQLLMPEETIRIFWPFAESIQQLADIFAVSYIAMKTRLQYLGFI